MQLEVGRKKNMLLNQYLLCPFPKTLPTYIPIHETVTAVHSLPEQATFLNKVKLNHITAAPLGL
jgi:hypothetical protein